MTNRLFCYWLQGYFEISKNLTLNKEVINKIESTSELINEPLWDEIKWLKQVCLYLNELAYTQTTINYFAPLIKKMLNSIFYHILDNDQEKEYTIDELHRLHQGIMHETE